MLNIADLWNSPYRVDHRRFQVRTEDGLKISGVYLDQQQTDTLLIYGHGFMSNKNHMRVPRFVEVLSSHFDVMAIDFRGHGESEGQCTMGEYEVLDLQATVAYARALGYPRIITIGSSMGGATAIRHAAMYGSQDGVVTIGAFADCRDIGRLSSDYGLQLLYNVRPIGEWYCYTFRRTRLGELCDHEAPVNLVNEIAPVPLMLIHGAWDSTVHPRSAEALFAAAEEPKELHMIPRGGHDYAHLTEKTASLIRFWIARHGLG
jgi:pimeloyl-ACP methyl ester carboxylesterase